MVDRCLVLKLSLKILEFCFATLNKYLVTSSYNMIVWVRLHFKPSSLRCKITVTPLEWVLGRDRVVSEPGCDLDGNLFSLPLGIDG